MKSKRYQYWFFFIGRIVLLPFVFNLPYGNLTNTHLKLYRYYLINAKENYIVRRIFIFQLKGFVKKYSGCDGPLSITIFFLPNLSSILSKSMLPEIIIQMRPQLNWIEHQTSDLRVEGSNPSARASIYQYWQRYLQLFLPLSFHSRSTDK